ncbi:MAG: class I SAM-dependent methyltransferase [Acidobacteria bacterium]|nr:class I SAM-dependent methyltransferase [Acidobacteriota bacterium]
MEIERVHFWFAGRRELVQNLLGRYAPAPGKVLDLGAGGGELSRRLSGCGYDITAADFLPGALVQLQRENRGIRALQCRAEQIPARDSSFDITLALDLLEHVDDAAAAREICRVLRPGGLAIVTVPAFRFLWSYRDEAAGHRRRYSKAEFKRLLTTAGLHVQALGYYQFFLFPLVALSRLTARRSPARRDLEDMPPRVVNAALSRISRWEAGMGRWHRWPWGSSLVGVARKLQD